MRTKVTDRQATIDWEAFRENTRKFTPVDLSESAGDKKKRIAALEANPQKWKEYYFPQYFKHPSPAFHKRASARLLRQFKKNKHWYEVRHWARGLAKSTVKMFDVLYLSLTGKLRNIILTSSTYDAAEGFLNRYMVQLDSNRRIINDYGPQELPGSWTAGDFKTKKGVRFLAVGAGQSPRGTGNEEVRADCIIADDFDTDEECRNPDIIDKKWDWFEKALFFTVDTSEPYLILWDGNIIAEDCCVVRAGKIADFTETINIRDENGKSVWPEKNSEKDIDYQTSKVSYEASQQELFNNPIRQGKTFKEITWGECPPLKELSFALAYADPAPSNRDKPTLRSKAQNSCKSVPIIGYKAPNFYVYKCWVDNTTNSDFVDWLFEAKAYVGSATQLYIYIENNTLQNPFYEQVLLPMIRSRSIERKTFLYVTPDTGEKPDKWVRIEGTLEPIVRLGHLVFNITEQNDPHMQRMTRQLLTASANSRTMDGPDSIQGAIKLIQLKTSYEASEGIKIIKRTSSKRF